MKYISDFEGFDVINEEENPILRILTKLGISGKYLNISGKYLKNLLGLSDDASKQVVKKKIIDVSNDKQLLNVVKQYKNDYIKRYGEGEYNRLLRDYLKKVKDREQFIDELKQSRTGFHPDKGGFDYGESIFGVKYGVKFLESELEAIENVAKNVFKDLKNKANGNVYNLEVFKNHAKSYAFSKKNIQVIIEDFSVTKPKINTAFASVNLSKGKIYFNSSLDPIDYELEIVLNALDHEVCHVKDPTMHAVEAVGRTYYTNIEGLPEYLFGLGDKMWWDPKWFKHYLHHPQEIVAYCGSYYTHLFRVSMGWSAKGVSPQLIKSKIDKAIQFFQKLSNENYEKAFAELDLSNDDMLKQLLGFDFEKYEGSRSYFFDTLKLKQNAIFKKLISRSAQQLEDCKAMINRVSVDTKVLEEQILRYNYTIDGKTIQAVVFLGAGGAVATQTNRKGKK